MKKIKSERGFTLIELSFVLIIFGMITATVMGAFTLYNKQAILDKTDEAIKNSNAALLEYVANFGVYPCPANPILGPGDMNYGREQRAGGLSYNDPGYDSQACAFPAVAVQGKDTIDPDTINDGVLIGSIPSVTIQERLLTTGVMYAHFSDFDSTDGWNRKLTYAVTQKLTDLDTFNSFLGAINAVDENNLPLTDEVEDQNNNGVLDVGEDLNGNGKLDVGQYPHFVLLSHGPNGRGAYMHNGQLVQPCVMAVPIPVPAPPGTSAINEIENCDNVDGKFMSGLLNESDFSFNDDKVKFTFYQNSSLWHYVADGTIANTNPGFVGIGTDQPQQMLHAVGEFTANRTRAVAYTDRSGGNLVPAESIGGDGSTADSAAMQCPAGQIVTKIEGMDIGGGVIRPKVTCGTPYGTTAPPDMTCPNVSGVQYVMYGVTTNGGGGTSLLCCDPTAAAGPTQCP